MGTIPDFAPHFDAWLIAGLWCGAYWVAFKRIAVRLNQPTKPTGWQLTNHCCAVLVFLIGSIWPVHDVGEDSMYFVHMAQHLACINVMAVFIVMSIPSWLARWILVRKGILNFVRFWTRFIPATILFNVLIVVFHWPAFVTLTVNNGWAHFAAHFVMVISFVMIWMVIISPAPEIRRPTPIVQMLFLFLQSVIPTIPATFLTFGTKPLYKIYVDKAKLFNMSALDDQRVAGIVMKLGSGLLLWAIIAVVFFRWSSSESGRELRYQRTKSNKLSTE